MKLHSYLVTDIVREARLYRKLFTYSKQVMPK